MHLRPVDKISHPAAKYSGLRTVVKMFSERVRHFEPETADRIHSCGSVIFHHVTNCEHEEHGKMYQSYYCKHPLCPACQSRKSHKSIAILTPALRNYFSNKNLFLYLVTLTLKNTFSLPSHSDLQKWKRNFLKDSFWKKRGIHGGMWALEPKIGSGSGLFHVHYHLLIATEIPFRQYVAKDGKTKVKLSQAKKITFIWSRVTGGKGTVTNSLVFDGRYAEVAKYITKGMKDFSDSQLGYLLPWIKGRRFRGFFGKLYANPELRAALESSDNPSKLDDARSPVCGVCGQRNTFKRFYRFNDDLHRYEYLGDIEQKLNGPLWYSDRSPPFG